MALLCHCTVEKFCLPYLESVLPLKHWPTRSMFNHRYGEIYYKLINTLTLSDYYIDFSVTDLSLLFIAQQTYVYEVSNTVTCQLFQSREILNKFAIKIVSEYTKFSKNKKKAIMNLMNI